MRHGTFLESFSVTNNHQHPLDLAKVRMQTAHVRVGLLQTLKNVFYKEGIATQLPRLTLRLPRPLQRIVRLPPPASDLLNRPFRRLRRIKRNLQRPRTTPISGSIDNYGLRIGMVSTPAAGPQV
jgi:hypothetical protein